jgi:hypothetical protein
MHIGIVLLMVVILLFKNNIMNNTIASNANGWTSKLMLAIFSIFLSVVTFAQETKKVDVSIDTDKGGGNFFASPWVWVIGVAIFILLLVALLRGKKD